MDPNLGIELTKTDILFSNFAGTMKFPNIDGQLEDREFTSGDGATLTFESGCDVSPNGTLGAPSYLDANSDSIPYHF